MSDSIEQIVRILIAQHQGDVAAAMRQRSGLPASHIGKLCGVPASQVYAWEQGLIQPTTTEGLRWLTVLHEQGPRQAVLSARSQAGQAVTEADHQAEREQQLAAIDASW